MDWETKTVFPFLFANKQGSCRLRLSRKSTNGVLTNISLSIKRRKGELWQTLNFPFSFFERKVISPREHSPLLLFLQGLIKHHYHSWFPQQSYTKKFLINHSWSLINGPYFIERHIPPFPSPNCLLIQVKSSPEYRREEKEGRWQDFWGRNANAKMEIHQMQ